MQLLEEVPVTALDAVIASNLGEVRQHAGDMPGLLKTACAVCDLEICTVLRRSVNAVGTCLETLPSGHIG